MLARPHIPVAMASAKKNVAALEALTQRADLSADERAALKEAIRVLSRGTRAEARRSKREKAPLPAATTEVEAILWTDGAARGNPGPAGIGAKLVARDGSELGSCSEYIGVATNNVAEYRALLAGLEEALLAGVRRLEVRADSELLIRQLEGRYRVKNERLKPLYARAQELIERFELVRLQHVMREDNSEADRLANEGIDSA